MEKWKEVYTEEQIKRVQEIELKNLAVLKSLCSKIGVTFFAYGGTLIGAVRHKGFIPWDDDLDVGMFRSDYERFIKEAPKYLPNNYDLQSPYTNKKTPYPYTKLRLKGTKYVEYGYHKLNIEQGIYIDIYPIDNLADDDDLYYKQFRRYQRLSKIYAWRQCPYLNDRRSTVKVFAKKSVKICLSYMLKIIPQKVLIKKLDRIATTYNGIETLRKGNLNFPRPVNFFYNMTPLEKGELNGQNIMLPGGWDQHLKSRYGNYMEFPPEQDRIGHKPYLLKFGDN